MPKKKNLNGIPGNLALSYLSTLGYYDGGYMADWLNFVARDKNVKEIEIDILTETIIPKEADIKPLKADLDKLRQILNKELSNNGFDMDFITKAIMKFEVPIDNPRIRNTVYCYPFIEDKSGKMYKPKKRVIETAYEVDFNPIKKIEMKVGKTKKGIIDKLKNLLKN